MSLFRGASFYITAHHLGDLPPPLGPEIAFAGRSNAGKSSAINTLVDHNRLAFVSKTPGRTQQINFFSLRGGAFLVDLPGYGYAKVQRKLRAHWEQLLSTYLQTRASLFGMVLIMDARHPLTPLDQQMLNWFASTGKPVHVLLSKSDKLSRQEGQTTLREVRAELLKYADNYTAQLFSSSKKQGMEETEEMIGNWLGIKHKSTKKAPG
ncbi:MAG: YihA family ribosome biogenesis GTP-binding protein [Betaproteobacteria bacterium RIFCSPLOWO2_12_FULL_62_13b]|nr:MAG: YihA family ribosome biogenesis GTP-binding protein [Betaproteobacteria bacterium RIFCSPLOWO2_12_FULL_62_13b]